MQHEKQTTDMNQVRTDITTKLAWQSAKGANVGHGNIAYLVFFACLHLQDLTGDIPDLYGVAADITCHSRELHPDFECSGVPPRDVILFGRFQCVLLRASGLIFDACDFYQEQGCMPTVRFVQLSS